MVKVAPQKLPNEIVCQMIVKRRVVQACHSVGESNCAELAFHRLVVRPLRDRGMTST
jgi:hypothetical protein